MNTSYSMVCVCAVILMVIGFLFARPLLSLFGASADAMVLRVSLYDDLSDRNFAVNGGNRHEPVHQRAGLLDRWHAFRHDRSGRKTCCLTRCLSLCLALVCRGAAIAAVISQTLSAVFVLYFLTRKSELKVRFVRKDEISECAGYARKYCQSRYRRIYHAADQQPCHDLLQQCTFCDRR